MVIKGETVAEKRKRLFNRSEGRLNLTLQGIPLWIWDNNLEYHRLMYRYTKGNCCFGHVVGMPENPKTGVVQPFFPYQQELLLALFNDAYANPGNAKQRRKHVLVKKAPGAGFTELCIYLMCYLPVAYPHVFYDSQMAVVTGINQMIATRIMKRMKFLLYQKLGIVVDSNENTLDINGCIIECYPAIKPNSYRGLDNPTLILYDEADFCPPSLIEDVRDAIERYFPKSDPYTILGSTANEPNGFMERIEKMDEERRLYKILYWLEDKVRGTMYTEEELALAQLSDSYPREFLGEYSGLTGSLFTKEQLAYATGEVDYLDVINKKTKQVVRRITRPAGQLSVKEITSDYRFLGPAYTSSFGTDPAYRSSIFGMVATKKIGDVVYAVDERELDHPSIEQAVLEVKSMMYDEYPSYYPKNFVDVFGSTFIDALKYEIHEPTDYWKMDPKDITRSMMNPTGMVVCPIPFQKYGDRMNYHWKRLVQLGMYRIDPDVTPLLYEGMRTAKYDDLKNKFDKDNTSNNDVFDAGRLANIYYNLDGQGVLFV